MPVTTCVFDAYGTLFDTASAAREVAQRAGGEAIAERWPRLAAQWRRKQIEYSWLRSLTGHHADFSVVTAEALDWALEDAGLSDPDLRRRLLAVYDQLPAFPEVAGVLGELKARGLNLAILSNGTPQMLAGAAAAAGIEHMLDAVLSVEMVEVYKPHPRVYDLITEHLPCRNSDVLFISSNGWDAAGAAAYGLRSIWVNRWNEPVERLPYRPARILADLSGLPAFVESGQ